MRFSSTSGQFILGIVALAFATPSGCLGQGTITTVAGSGTSGFSGDGGSATKATIGGSGGALGVTIDSGGNLLIVDAANERIRMVNGAGVIQTIAGNGVAGYLGDGGPATRAQLAPSAAAVDKAGNIYVAAGPLVRKIDTAGVITTVAGFGTSFGSYSGDGGPATSAGFLSTAIALDGAGNIYLADSINHRIRKVDTSGTITTVAGTGTSGFSGDGGPATKAALALPQGLAADSAGNLYFADNSRVRKVDTSGVITTVAGNGSPIGIGENVAATSIGLLPVWVAVDGAGNLYIAESVPSAIRKVNTSGLISTVAGSISSGFSGDGAPATSATLNGVTGVAVDGAGNIYIADNNNYRIRKISVAAALVESPGALSFAYSAGGAAPASQTLNVTSPGSTLSFSASPSTTLGGSWLSVSPSSGSTPAALTVSISAGGLAPGTYNGTITITSSGAGNSPQTVAVTLTVSPSGTAQGTITTVAGNGSALFSGDGGPATSAGISPVAVAADGSGNLYIADAGLSQRVRKVSASGTITTLAGNGTFSYSGDGGAGNKAGLFNPTGVAVDKSGNVYIADSMNERIRKVDGAGTITTFAGNGATSPLGDGGPATSAAVVSPLAVAFDGGGNLLIADNTTARIRKVTGAGTISTIAGGNLATFSGDGGPATSAGLLLPGGIATDAAGNVYIADVGNGRIRRVNTSGVINTVAGNGTKGFSGDGGPATSAQLNLTSGHTGLAVDSAGNLYIADTGNHRIRKVDGSGIITTVAGNGVAGYTGDGGPPNSASLNNPEDIAFDGAGNLYIADSTNLRIRKVSLGGGGGGTGSGTTPAIAANGVVNGASFKPGIVPNSWVTIAGTNLAPVTDTWNNAIVNGKLPAALDGVSVTIGGKPAYLSYISSTQINLLAPDVAPGSVPVVVTTPSGSSTTMNVTASQYGPAFFPWPGNQAVATHQDFSFAAKNGSFAGITTTPAKPGDVIILWATGLGPTTPSPAAGSQVPGDQTYNTSTLPTVTVNNLPATVYGAALAPGFAGVYQVAIQVPTTLGNGDWPVVLSIGGVQSPSGMVLTVQQ